MKVFIVSRLFESVVLVRSRPLFLVTRRLMPLLVSVTKVSF